MANFVGSILELKDNKATVMMDTCDFVIINRQPEMFVGQQICFQKSDLYSPKRNYVRYLALVASVFIIAFSYIFYNQFFIPSTVFAYIDVDINPSIEFAVDKNTQVVDIKPLNDDGETLLKNLKLIKLPVKQAIAEVVKESKQQGFIKPNIKSGVLVSASIDVDENYKPNESERKVLDDILSDIGDITIDLGDEKIKPEVLQVTPKERSLAVKNEISMGRYDLYNKLKEEDTNITVEQAKHFRVSDMLDRTKEKGLTDVKPENGNDNKLNMPEKNKNGDSSSSENNKRKSDIDNTVENKDSLKSNDEEAVNKSNNDSNTETLKDKSNNISQSATLDKTSKEVDIYKKGTNSDKDDKPYPSDEVAPPKETIDNSKTDEKSNVDQKTTVPKSKKNEDRKP